MTKHDILVTYYLGYKKMRNYIDTLYKDHVIVIDLHHIISQYHYINYIIHRLSVLLVIHVSISYLLILSQASVTTNESLSGSLLSPAHGCSIFNIGGTLKVLYCRE